MKVINIIQAPRNHTAHKPTASLQYQAMAYLAGIETGVFITERDAARCGFRVQGQPLFDAPFANGHVAGGHPQYDATKLVFVGRTPNTSRVSHGMRLAERWNPEQERLAIQKANAAHGRTVEKLGHYAGLLLGNVPFDKAVKEVAAIHEGRGPALAAFVAAFREIKRRRWPHL